MKTNWKPWSSILLPHRTLPQKLLCYLKSEYLPPSRPPDTHRSNLAERAIQTFKNHFVSILLGVDRSFLIKLWDRLLPQAVLTLNLCAKQTPTQMYLCTNTYMEHSTTIWHRLVPWVVQSNPQQQRKTTKLGRALFGRMVPANFTWPLLQSLHFCKMNQQQKKIKHGKLWVSIHNPAKSHTSRHCNQSNQRPDKRSQRWSGRKTRQWVHSTRTTRKIGSQQTHHRTQEEQYFEAITARSIPSSKGEGSNARRPCFQHTIKHMENRHNRLGQRNAHHWNTTWHNKWIHKRGCDAPRNRATHEIPTTHHPPRFQSSVEPFIRKQIQPTSTRHWRPITRN